MNIKGFFKNPLEILKGNKAGVSQDHIPVVLESQQPVLVEEPKKKKIPLQEQERLINAKKKEVDELYQKRQDYFIEAKQLEEKMTLQGLSEEKKNDLREQIMEEGGEVTKLIREIKEEYGLETTPTDIYAGRLQMIEKELERIENNMAPEYRKVLGIIENSYPGERAPHHDQTFGYLRQALDNNEVRSIPEVAAFNKLSFEDQVVKLPEFRKEIQEIVKEKTLYKTEGDLREAQIRKDRLISLHDAIAKEMKDSSRKEGRFADQSEYF